MKDFKVEFVKSAKKEYDKLPQGVKAKINEVLSVLSRNPYSELLNIKKLKGEDSLFRVRLGDYRVVYLIENKKLIIVVIKIGHRKDVY